MKDKNHEVSVDVNGFNFWYDTLENVVIMYNLNSSQISKLEEDLILSWKTDKGTWVTICY